MHDNGPAVAAVALNVALYCHVVPTMLDVVLFWMAAESTGSAEQPSSMLLSVCPWRVRFWRDMFSIKLTVLPVMDVVRAFSPNKHSGSFCVLFVSSLACSKNEMSFLAPLGGPLQHRVTSQAGPLAWLRAGMTWSTIPDVKARQQSSHRPPTMRSRQLHMFQQHPRLSTNRYTPRLPNRHTSDGNAGST